MRGRGVEEEEEGQSWLRANTRRTRHEVLCRHELMLVRTVQSRVVSSVDMTWLERVPSEWMDEQPSSSAACRDTLWLAEQSYEACTAQC